MTVGGGGQALGTRDSLVNKPCGVECHCISHLISGQSDQSHIIPVVERAMTPWELGFHDHVVEQTVKSGCERSWLQLPVVPCLALPGRWTVVCATWTPRKNSETSNRSVNSNKWWFVRVCIPELQGYLCVLWPMPEQVSGLFVSSNPEYCSARRKAPYCMSQSPWWPPVIKAYIRYTAQTSRNR